MQGWSLERKIRVTQTRIMEWYMRYDGQVFISFSGGKDSTVLLDLARRVYDNNRKLRSGTGQTVNYALKQNLRIIFLHPDTAEIS